MGRDTGEAMANNKSIWDGKGIFKNYYAQHGPFIVFKQYKQRTWIVGKLIFVTWLPFHPQVGLHGSHFLSLTYEYRQPHLWMSMIIPYGIPIIPAKSCILRVF